MEGKVSEFPDQGIDQLFPIHIHTDLLLHSLGVELYIPSFFFSPGLPVWNTFLLMRSHCTGEEQGDRENVEALFPFFSS